MSDLAPSGSAAGLALVVPPRLGRWICRAIDVLDESHVRFRFEVPDAGEWLQVSILSPDATGRVARRLRHCAVRYDASLTALTPDRKAEAGAIVVAVGEAADARLAASPGRTIAEAFGRRRDGATRIVFGRESLRALLSPDIVPGVPVAAGFVLTDVYPTSYLRDRAAAALELVIEFRREADERRVLLQVSPRDERAPAFVRTAHFNVAQLTLGAVEPEGADALRATVSFLLQLRDHEGVEVVFPDPEADVAPALLPARAEAAATSAADEVLNLAINADCGQRCNFCSIRETSPAEDGGDRVFARLAADLASNRARGVRRVRINGYDPLAYSRIVEVLGRARALGYEHVDVFSPCTRLADEAFCDAVVAELPASGVFHVPLYAADAAVHDAVVGTPGAHARVARALELLCERVGAARILLLGVATADNLDHLEAAARFGAARGLSYSAHLPYPSFESPADRFFQAAPRQSEVAARMARARLAGVRLRVEGVAPCVVFEAMRAAGVHASDWLEEDEGAHLVPGTEYRDARFRHRAEQADHAAFHAATVPCPHAERCALRPVCAAEVLRSYVELHGLDEIAPVRPATLARS